MIHWRKLHQELAKELIRSVSYISHNNVFKSSYKSKSEINVQIQIFTPTDVRNGFKMTSTEAPTYWEETAATPRKKTKILKKTNIKG